MFSSLFLFGTITTLKAGAYSDEKDCESYEGVGNCAYCDGGWHRKAACGCLATISNDLANEKGKGEIAKVSIRVGDDNNMSGKTSNWVMIVGSILLGIVIGTVGYRTYQSRK